MDNYQICKTCNKDGFSYSFSSQKKNIMEANDECEKQNGTLATNLNEASFKHINSCCKQILANEYYWIGLYKTKHTCNKNGENKFLWVASDRSCTAAEPLKLVRYIPKNMCLGVKIRISKTDKVPEAAISHCTTDVKYICEHRLQLVTTQNDIEFKTTAAAGTEATAAATTTSKISATTAKEAKPSLRTSTKSAAFSMTTQSVTRLTQKSSSYTPRAANITPVIASVILGVLLLLLLTLIIVYKYKKGAFKKQLLPSSLKKRKTKVKEAEEKENEIYNMPDLTAATSSYCNDLKPASAQEDNIYAMADDSHQDKEKTVFGKSSEQQIDGKRCVVTENEYQIM